MSLDSWMLLWKIILIGGIGLFATLAVVVSIGGFFDVFRLLRVLREQHAQDQHAQDRGSPDG
jgi:hypothetical protein